MIKKYTSAGVVLSALLVANFALAKPTNQVLNIGVTQEFETLNPIIAQMVATNYIRQFALRGLLVMSADGKQWEPQLITKIPTLENGLAHFVGTGKNRKIESVWEIDPKAVWGDGVPVTAEDVVFSRTVALSPNVSVGERETYAQVEKIEIDKQNPKKFTMISKPKWDFSHLGTFYIVSKHLEETPFKKFAAEKEGYGKNTLYVTDPLNKGLYAGPYLISEIKLGDHVTLVENPRWWGQKPAIKKINVKLIPVSSALESNLRSNTIDMISILGLSFDEAIAFEKRVKTEHLPYKVNFVPGLTYEHLDVNLHNPILSDVRVRKALVYAMNRDELVKALFEGRQQKAIHWMAPIDPWYTEDPSRVVLYPPSRRQAEKLLDEAGWKKNEADGYRYKGGKKLSFSIMTTAGNKVRELVEVFLQNEWKKIGAEVLIKNEPGRVFFGETVRKGLYPGMAMFAWMSSPENSPRSQFHSEMIPTKANGFSGQNSGGWKNPSIDKEIEELEGEFNPKKRLELVGQILHAYTDEIPVIPLYYRSEVTVTPENLKGYVLPGHQFSETNWAEKWSLE
jgi:peptide/nickel transport system substrate-binding protein